MKLVKVFLILFILTIVLVALLFGLGEYVRINYTLQEFKNVKTNKASFSLTTIPSRINLMEPNIKSLLAQKPKTIYLNVPFVLKKTGEKYVIPKWMKKYTDSGQVTLIRCEDKGPATKFLGLLEHDKIHPDHYIIVVDDDHTYNIKLLSNMIHKADQIGGNKVVSANIDFGLVTGYSGYIFKRKLLDGIKTFVWPNECFLVDDAWITSYFRHSNIVFVQLFDISVSNVSTENSNSILEFIYNICISNINLPANSYRSLMVSKSNSLYVDRGFKDMICSAAVDNLLSN